MVNLDAIRNTLGIIGNVISFGLFASPAPTFYTIIQRKDVEQFSPNPYLATILNCMMWVFYGMPFIHPNSTLVWTINGIGLIIELTYISIYIRFANSKQRMWVTKVLVGEIMFMAVVIVCTMLFFHDTKGRGMAVGILCVIFNICMYAMPLDVMRLVISTKSVEYLPFYLSLANFLNGSIWTGYALIHFDIYMTISNGSGTLLGLIQLLLYATYYKSTPQKEKNAQSSEVQMSNDV